MPKWRVHIAGVLAVATAWFVSGCSSGTGTGTGTVIGGGGDYTEALARIGTSIAWTSHEIVAGNGMGTFCHGVSGLDSDQKAFIRSIASRNAGKVLDALPNVTFEVASGELSVKGKPVKERVTRQGDRYRIEIRQSPFDNYEGWYLAFHGLMHVVEELDDDLPVSVFPGPNGTRQALDYVGRCAEDYWTRHTYAAALDPGFQENGAKLISDTTPYSEVLPTEGGKLLRLSHVVTGSGGPGSANPQQECRITRYNADLSIDRTFGVSGQFTTVPAITSQYAIIDPAHPPYSGRVCQRMLLQKDGKILLAGTVYVAGYYWNASLIRVNPDGAIDSRFAYGGYFSHSLNPARPNGSWGVEGAGGASIAALAVDASSNILAAGYTVTYGNGYYYKDRFLVRFTPSGALDSTFGGNGIRVLPEPTRSSHASKVLVRPDGKYVLVGNRLVPQTGRGDQIMVSLLLPDGRLDPGFGTSGTAAVSTTADRADALTLDAYLQRDGKIVLGSRTGTTTGIDSYLVVRFFPTGALDRGFGDAGRQILTHPASISGGHGQHQPPWVFPRDNGGVLLAANLNSASGPQMVLIGLKADGSVDTEFKASATISGIVPIRLGGGQTSLVDARLQPDGKLLVVGTTLPSPPTSGASDTARRVFFARFLVDGTP